MESKRTKRTKRTKLHRKVVKKTQYVSLDELHENMKKNRNLNFRFDWPLFEANKNFIYGEVVKILKGNEKDARVVGEDLSEKDKGYELMGQVHDAYYAMYGMIDIDNKYDALPRHNLDTIWDGLAGWL